MTSSPAPGPAPTPLDPWPVSGLRVVSGDLELRYLDDPLLLELAALAAAGIHPPDVMPFSVPWTRGTPQEVARSVLTYQWGVRSRLSPQSWALELAVVHDGVVAGVQAAAASAFPVTRTLETGSWLGRRHQGSGLGTRMRLLMLHLAFEGLGARTVTTSAFEDNAPSTAVTRRIGYLPNGEDTVEREGSPVRSHRFVLDRATWERRPDALRPAVTLHGVAATRTFLGLDPS